MLSVGDDYNAAGVLGGTEVSASDRDRIAVKVDFVARIRDGDRAEIADNGKPAAAIAAAAAGYADIAAAAAARLASALL